MKPQLPLSTMTRLPTEHDEMIEEALSEIFECFENDLHTEDQIKPVLNAKVKVDTLEELRANRLVLLNNGRISLTPEGERVAHEVIRCKRLAERLLKDVLNVKDEFIDPAACQWEHILSFETKPGIAPTFVAGTCAGDGGGSFASKRIAACF